MNYTYIRLLNIIFFLLIFINWQCKDATNLPTNTFVDDIDSLPPSYPNPYYVNNNSKEIILKISHELDTIKAGKAVISLFINDEGQKDGYNVTYLNFISDKDSLRFNRYSPQRINLQEYPKKVQEFLPIFNKYIDTLKITKRGNYNLNNNYILNIPITLK